MEILNFTQIDGRWVSDEFEGDSGKTIVHLNLSKSTSVEFQQSIDPNSGWATKASLILNGITEFEYEKPCTDLSMRVICDDEPLAASYLVTQDSPEPTPPTPQKTSIEILDLEGEDTFNLEDGVYYSGSGVANTVTFILPEILDNTKVSNVILGFTTGTTPVITFESADNKVIRMADGFEFEAEKTYEVNALYNGSYWSIAGIVIAAISGYKAVDLGLPSGKSGQI